MTRILMLLAGVATLSAAAPVQAAPRASAASFSEGTILQAQYSYSPHHRFHQQGYYGRVNHKPWIWRYQDRFRSNARDFYGSKEFQGGP